ncbi:unnamed protein product [Mucor hiemalis]
MSLLLTKTCEYAILVSIQQGRYFSVNNNGAPYSVKIEAELNLKLPPSIEDLIPTRTILHSPPSKVDTNGNCTFNISLVYFVSFKQLQRLRRTNAKTTIRVLKIDSEGASQTSTSSLQFSVSEAKEVIPQSQHKLDQIYKFVLDKGAWFTTPKTRQQIRVGLFYVAMPDNTGNNSSVTSNSSVLITPSIQLRSPPATPIMPKRVTATNSNRKKKITSILGAPSTLFTNTTSSSNNSGSSSSNSTTTTNSTTASSLRLKKSSTPSIREEDKKLKRVPLKRTKSSLVDLNIEELADVLKQINLFSSNDEQSPPPPPSVPALPPPYHQIGKGSSRYTFYLRIMYVDHIKSSLLRQTTPFSKKITHIKKPFFGYTFLTNYNLTPAASINQLVDRHDGNKSCFQLRGHLYDIQNWLDAQGYIGLNYILMDKYTKETVGQSKIPLQGIAFEGMSDKIYPVYDSMNDEIAKVTVRIGLVSGWRKEEGEEVEELQLHKRKPIQSSTFIQPNGEDPWNIIQNKKTRHLSQSSVPTLLTSSTTSTTTKSSTPAATVPTIQYIQQQPRPTSLKKSKYFSTTSSYSSFMK